MFRNQWKAISISSVNVKSSHRTILRKRHLDLLNNIVNVRLNLWIISLSWELQPNPFKNYIQHKHILISCKIAWIVVLYENFYIPNTTKNSSQNFHAQYKTQIPLIHENKLIRQVVIDTFPLILINYLFHMYKNNSFSYYVIIKPMQVLCRYIDS